LICTILRKHNTLILINLTPLKHPEKSAIFQGTRLIPLSFKGEGERTLGGASPPSLIYTPLPLIKYRNAKWKFKRGGAPLHKNTSPSPFKRGRGI
jgi:hypothetical protein